MAQYVSFAPDVQVIGQTILSFVHAVASHQETMQSILEKHGLKNVQPEEWYSQQAWLDAFQEIGEHFGANTLFAIGKAIPENAIFPPNIQDLKGALSIIDVAYHMNHQGGEIGYYKLLEYHEDARTAVMECKNPYPSDFDRGIITTMARKFKPEDSIVAKVELDSQSPTRLQGADSCRYIVTW